MALTLEQEKALLALLYEKRTTLPELSATTELTGSDLFLTNQMLADKSVTADVMKQFIAPDATLSRKGVVQLNNQVNSDSETQAATSKAVKQAYDLAYRKVNSVNGKKGTVTLTPDDIGAISQTDADNRYLQLENAPDFLILYPGGTNQAPGSISSSQRVVIDNPWQSESVICQAQIYVNNGWYETGFIYSSPNGHGVDAYATEQHIIIQSGRWLISSLSSHSGNPAGITTTTTVSEGLYRVKAWRI